MKIRSISLVLGLAILCSAATSAAQRTRFKVLAFYSTNVEADHVEFAEAAVQFFATRAISENFTFESTTDWQHMNEAYLKAYQLVIWLNDAPTNAAQRLAFERYMENGGGWLGFHFAGYNDKDTKWPWFVDFLEEQSSTATIGRHCRQSSLSMTALIRTQRTFPNLTNHPRTNGTSGSPARDSIGMCECWRHSILQIIPLG